MKNLEFRQNQFKTFESRISLKLAFVNPDNPPEIKPGSLFSFDGSKVRLLNSDGSIDRDFDKADSVRGFLNRFLGKEVVECQVKVPRSSTLPKSKKVVPEKPSGSSRFFDLMNSKMGVQDSESSEASEEEWEDSEEEEWEDSEEDEENEEEEWGNDEKDLHSEIRPGISVDRNQRSVRTQRVFGDSGSPSLESTSRASISNLSSAISGTEASVGSSFMTKTASGDPKIGYEPGREVHNVVFKIPSLSGAPINVGEVAQNAAEAIERSAAKAERIYIGEGKKALRKVSEKKEAEKERLEKFIAKQEREVLPRLKERVKGFSWSLRDPEVSRFERALEIWKKSNGGSSKDRKFLEAIMEYETPPMKKRIQKEIDFLLEGGRS